MYQDAIEIRQRELSIQSMACTRNPVTTATPQTHLRATLTMGTSPARYTWLGTSFGLCAIHCREGS